MCSSINWDKRSSRGWASADTWSERGAFKVNPRVRVGKFALILLLRSKTFIHVIEDTKDVHNLPHGQCKTTAHWELNLVLHRKILFHFIKQMEQL